MRGQGFSNEPDTGGGQGKINGAAAASVRPAGTTTTRRASKKASAAARDPQGLLPLCGVTLGPLLSPPLVPHCIGARQVHRGQALLITLAARRDSTSNMRIRSGCIAPRGIKGKAAAASSLAELCPFLSSPQAVSITVMAWRRCGMCTRIAIAVSPLPLSLILPLLR